MNALVQGKSSGDSFYAPRYCRDVKVSGINVSMINSEREKFSPQSKNHPQGKFFLYYKNNKVVIHEVATNSTYATISNSKIPKDPTSEIRWIRGPGSELYDNPFVFWAEGNQLKKMDIQSQSVSTLVTIASATNIGLKGTSHRYGGGDGNQVSEGLGMFAIQKDLIGDVAVVDLINETVLYEFSLPHDLAAELDYFHLVESDQMGVPYLNVIGKGSLLMDMQGQEVFQYQTNSPHLDLSTYYENGILHYHYLMKYAQPHVRYESFYQQIYGDAFPSPTASSGTLMHIDFYQQNGQFYFSNTQGPSVHQAASTLAAQHSSSSDGKVLLYNATDVVALHGNDEPTVLNNKVTMAWRDEGQGDLLMATIIENFNEIDKPASHQTEGFLGPVQSDQYGEFRVFYLKPFLQASNFKNRFLEVKLRKPTSRAKLLQLMSPSDYQTIVDRLKNFE